MKHFTSRQRLEFAPVLAQNSAKKRNKSLKGIVVTQETIDRFKNSKNNVTTDIPKINFSQ